MPDPFKPNDTLLCKLGSAIVHADEAMGDSGTAEDEAVFRSLLADPEVDVWIKEMNELGLLPVKRDA